MCTLARFECVFFLQLRTGIVFQYGVVFFFQGIFFFLCHHAVVLEEKYVSIRNTVP